MEIGRILRQKLSTARLLMTSPRAPHVRAIKRLPVLQRMFQKRYLRNILAEYYGVAKESFQPSQDKLHVGLVITDGLFKPRSSAFIRLISPLTDPLIAKKVYLTILSEDEIRLSNVDICIVQRTAFSDIEKARDFIEKAKSTNVKIVIDSDDGFHAIDPSHPEHQELQSRVNAFDYIIKNADQIWFSTQALAESYPSVKNKVKVVPNSLDSRIWSKKNAQSSQPKSKKLQLLYMGTATHDADFAMILPALDRLHDLEPNSFELSMIGVSESAPDRPWLHSLIQTSESIYPRFVEWFSTCGSFDFGLSPLVKSEFNRHKSDIKCLDYIAAGTVPLVSAIEPYNSIELNDFIVRSQNTTEEWFSILSNAVKDLPKTRTQNKERVRLGQKYLWQNRDSKKTGELLYKYMAGINSQT